jgi:hypothetical protein
LIHRFCTRPQIVQQFSSRRKAHDHRLGEFCLWRPEPCHPERARAGHNDIRPKKHARARFQTTASCSQTSKRWPRPDNLPGMLRPRSRACAA